ncbi:sugar ABC transporter substrate-binding protein [uncultured Sphaerochaeta sp.]|uniref:ABC transporter substrate-binding protein n=1 Tax=uncultured Sphaerochaeta sp. TaxID=886478 RepID=UPI002A0A3CE7|nr:sugar ABC transporter substrate-binding protein [uncultured Sphaerochaeta sp.]
MKKVKKGFVLLLILLSTTFVCFANGTDEKASGKGTSATQKPIAPLKLAGWSYEVDTVDANLKVFTEQTGISADSFYSFPSNQFHDKMVTSFIGGAGYDVIYVRDSYLAEWASAGWIIPVDGFADTASIKANLSQGAIDQMTYDGKLYGLPYYAGRRVFAYNEDHLKKAGFNTPPQTWDEMFAQAKVIKEKGISEYPIILDLAKCANIVEQIETMVFSYGGRLFDANNKPVFATSDGTLKKVLQDIKDNMGVLIDPASLVATDHEVVRALSAGTRTFSTCTDYNLKTVNDPASSQVAGQVKMGLIPGSAKVKSGSIGNIRLYCISSSCKNPQAAWELVKFLGYKDKNGEYFVPKKWALDFGLGFVQTELFDDKDIQASINSWGDTEVMKQQDDYVVSRPYRFTPWFEEWQTQAWEDLQKAIMGDVTIDATLQKMAKSANDLMQQYK